MGRVLEKYGTKKAQKNRGSNGDILKSRGIVQISTPLKNTGF